MGHPVIENETPFVFEPVFLADLDGCPVVVPLVKATFAIEPDGRLDVPEEPDPVRLDGEFYGDPDTSSYRFEPECALHKPHTDVALVGHAWAPNPRTTELEFTFAIGTIQKTAVIWGPRRWEKSFLATRPSDPAPFEKTPLMYELGFGGWDRRDEDPAKHKFEPRNPVGTGFLASRGHIEEGAPLPRIEHPKKRMRGPMDRPPPIGFGFTSPHWEPRRKLAGTYGKAWEQKRKPLLPEDFDLLFFNAASEGLVLPGRLAGNERIAVSHASPAGLLSFGLPGIPPPDCVFTPARGEETPVELALDTVIVDTDAMKLHLLWRGAMRNPDGPESIRRILVQSPAAARLFPEAMERMR